MTATTTSPAVTRQHLLAAFDDILQPGRFKDYGPNGLQVEGKAEIRTLVSGVTASLALIEAAVAAGADALVVHHGLFWRGQDGRVTGWMKQRLAALLASGINLYAYHLPLDAHAELGNNAQLGARLGVQAERHFGEQDLGSVGPLDAPLAAEEWVSRVERVLGRTPTWVPGDGRPLRQIAWCTGGAQGYFEAAIAAGADAYVTGEISEPQAHYAREMGVAFIAAGHHATERYGVQALGAQVAGQLGLSHRFIDIDNPA
ncbi:dinuclear metal center YbgI/SA1388 family protein [Comamonas sp. BIGb0124]|uniref:Nif3-like dinuclear metal center hexameric protein n=1 Tax=Comamonas sp. BIGb0124 TaxID=2485130 RepID=UPI000F4ABAAB|nr:Nif3-like dinuclear metal center hexameric protein [Comamonas sp. BIGb0124]ROR20468.1 dinuclear metal center YbgI/SA1388 family protein [Comamonas sp. BIGb0124]